MKIRPHSSTALLLTALPLLAPAAAAQDSPAERIIGNGDILPGGYEVDFATKVRVHDSGSWTMLVLTTAGQFIVVRNGNVTIAPGDIISTGEEVFRVDGFDLSPSGSLAYALTIRETSGALRSVLYTAGAPWIEQGDTFADPAGGPDDYEIHSISQVAIANPYMAVECSVSGAGDPLQRDAVLRFDFTVPLAPIIEIISEEGTPAPGGGTLGGRPNVTQPLDVLLDGRVLSGTTVDGDNATLFDGAIVARNGQPTPNPTYVWGLLLGANVSSSGHLALVGDVDLASTGALEGRRIFVDGVMRVDSGQPFGTGTSGPFFYQGFVDRQGRLHYTHSSSSTGGYAIDGDVLMEEGLSTVSGAAVLGFDGLDLKAVSDSGRYAILDPDSDPLNTRDPYALLETALGSVVSSCPTVPNSTGVVSKLRATGSSKIGVGPFPMTASDLPPGQPGLLVCSTTAFVTMNPAGSTGNLCLGGAIGRFRGQIGVSDAAGEIGFSIDAQSLPQPGGFTSAVSGELWGFQLWHRDTSPGGPTSNFSQTRAIEFR